MNNTIFIDKQDIKTAHIINEHKVARLKRKSFNTNFLGIFFKCFQKMKTQYSFGWHWYDTVEEALQNHEVRLELPSRRVQYVGYSSGKLKYDKTTETVSVQTYVEVITYTKRSLVKFFDNPNTLQAYINELGLTEKLLPLEYDCGIEP